LAAADGRSRKMQTEHVDLQSGMPVRVSDGIPLRSFYVAAVAYFVSYAATGTRGDHSTATRRIRGASRRARACHRTRGSCQRDRSERRRSFRMRSRPRSSLRAQPLVYDPTPDQTGGLHHFFANLTPMHQDLVGHRQNLYCAVALQPLLLDRVELRSPVANEFHGGHGTPRITRASCARKVTSATRYPQVREVRK